MVTAFRGLIKRYHINTTKPLQHELSNGDCARERKAIASRNIVIKHLAKVTKLDSIQTPKLVESYIAVVGFRNDIVFNILISCCMDGGFS